jgi:hypothetical protein
MGARSIGSKGSGSLASCAASSRAWKGGGSAASLDQTYPAEPDADGEEARTLRPLQAAAVTYRIAFGPRAGQKVLTLSGAERGHGTVPADGPVPREGLAHTKRERGLQGMPREDAARQPLCAERVQLNAAGQVELKLKTPWRDGTTHLVMSPLEFMQRLAARATEGCRSGSRAAAEAAPHQFGVRVTSLREVSGPPLHEPRRSGTERQAAACGGAARPARAGTGGNRGYGRHRVRSRSSAGPAAPHELGAAAQARL